MFTTFVISFVLWRSNCWIGPKQSICSLPYACRSSREYCSVHTSQQPPIYCAFPCPKCMTLFFSILNFTYYFSDQSIDILLHTEAFLLSVNHTINFWIIWKVLYLKSKSIIYILNAQMLKYWILWHHWNNKIGDFHCPSVHRYLQIFKIFKIWHGTLANLLFHWHSSISSEIPQIN